MPKIRKVPLEEAQTWGRRNHVRRQQLFRPPFVASDQHWSFHRFSEMTQGDTEGIHRTRIGWHVSVDVGRKRIVADFAVSQYHSLEEALNAAIQARTIIRDFMHEKE